MVITNVGWLSFFLWKLLLITIQEKSFKHQLNHFGFLILILENWLGFLFLKNIYIHLIPMKLAFTNVRTVGF